VSLKVPSPSQLGHPGPGSHPSPSNPPTNHPPGGQGGAVSALRITPDLVHSAAARLVSQSNPNVEVAARRLVATAPDHGIDLSLIWGTVEPRQGRRPSKVRQACMAVLGAGRTAMLFISEPAASGDFGDPARALAERVACIDAACAHLGREMGERVAIAQALPDPAETWSVDALNAANFIKVGDLSYLRREGAPLPRTPASGKGRTPLAAIETGAELEPGLTVSRLNDLDEASADDVLLEALENSYTDTLDCPELCGLRETRDVLASHKDTGDYDPRSWWLLFLHGRPHGCALFSDCPELRCAELVYLGLSPRLRGRGLGRLMLCKGLEEVRRRHPAWAMTLAVDHRNTPALRLYASMGFKAFGERVALVRPVGGKK
jgi:ribosomal protein S18 acetylase RimI-like enzyme